MTKLAVMSDIHGNLDAFEAVLADAEKLGVDKIVCLGDLACNGESAKGVEPIVDLFLELRGKGKLEVCLLGNCDRALLRASELGFPGEDFWGTREELEASTTPEALARWDFLAEAPRVYKKDNFLFAHGSPRNPFDEPVDGAVDRKKMAKFFELTPQYCFIGHTHVPGVFVEENGGFSYFPAAELEGGVFPLDERKLLANVGSVGASRDGDPRPCYVVARCEENGANNQIEFRRL